MRNKIVRSRRKYTLTKHQSTYIFHVSIKPFIGGKVYNGEISRLKYMPETYVVIDRFGNIAVSFGYDLEGLYRELGICKVLIQPEDFRNMAFDIINQKGDNPESIQNNRIYGKFRNGLQQVVKAKLSGGFSSEKALKS